MRRLALQFWALLLVLLLGGCASTPSALPWPAGLPVYDHVVVVVLENKDYDDIIGNPAAPYINDVLRREGALFTRSYGAEHNSQGNYYWLFSGSNHGIGFSDQVPTRESHPDYPFRAPNLGAQLIARGLTFKGYSEGLPAIGSLEVHDTSGLYARKHVPWTSFANLPNGSTVETSSNLRWSDFPPPGSYHRLPTVAFVIPNLDHDMHNGPPAQSIPRGDRWLRDHLDAYYQWAKSHNSLLVLTFDESNDQRGYQGLTQPGVDPQTCRAPGRDHQLCLDLQNRIATLFAGAHVQPGDYAEGPGITHVNVLRTLEAMYGLPRAGAQQPNAAGIGIRDDFIITDVFRRVP